jgi:DNA polymerase III subunit gamma/tau
MSTQLSITSRPRKFSDVIGQKSVVSECMSRKKENKWPTATLLKGPTGTGKTTIANIIAMTINCKKLDAEGNPCCECPSCKSIIQEKFDRDTIVLDGSSSDKENVIDFSQLADTAPLYDKEKILIIEEADQLGPKAKTSLLKVLEKPRKNIRFILLSMIPNGLPPSIQSRCQVFNFKAFSVQELMFGLKSIMEKTGDWQNADIPQTFKLNGLLTIASSAKASFREAIQILEKCLIGEYFTPELIRENTGVIDEATTHEAIMALLNRDKKFFELIDSLDITEFFNLSYTILVDSFVYKLTGKMKNEFFENNMKEISSHRSFREFIHVYDALAEDAKPYLRKAQFISRIANWYTSSPLYVMGIQDEPVKAPVKTVGTKEQEVPVRGTFSEAQIRQARLDAEASARNLSTKNEKIQGSPELTKL